MKFTNKTTVYTTLLHRIPVIMIDRLVKKSRSNRSKRIALLLLLVSCFLYAFFQNQTQMTSTLSMLTEQEVIEGAPRDDKLSVVPVGNDFQLAKDQSFGFFTDISSNQWKMHQKTVAEYVPHKNPVDPLEYVPGHSIKRGDWVNSARAFYQTNYEPNFSCALERRVGGNGNGDGPKVSRYYHNRFIFDDQMNNHHSLRKKTRLIFVM